MTLGLAWLLLLGAMASCAPPQAATTAATAAITVHALPEHCLSLTLDGAIDNREQVAHALPLAWVPLQTIAAEGDAISAGSSLATLDTHIASFWDEDGRFKLEEARRNQELSLLSLQQRIHDLELKKGDLEAQARVLRAQIAASTVQDSALIAIARLDVERTERILSNGDANLTRVTALAQAGHASPADLAKAHKTRDLAAAACVKPRITLLLLAPESHPTIPKTYELELQRIQQQLGADGQGGIAGDLVDLQALLDRQSRLGSDELARQERDSQVRHAVINHPVIVARANGILRYRNDDVRPGAKLPASSFAFILTDREMIASFQLPEALRALIPPPDPEHPFEDQAVVTIGSLDDERFSGHILSISAAPTTGSDGRRVFACAIRFDDRQAASKALLERLRPGMRVRCLLRIPTVAQALTIPIWCVDSSAQPRVRLENGDERPVQGFAAGNDFIVTSGLQDGMRLSGDPDRRPPTGLRLSGVVEASRCLPIRLSSGGWELLEVVTDGALVEQGQVIARLGKANYWRDSATFAFEADYGAAKARADYDVARADAAAAAAKALAAWHDAQIDALQKELAIAGGLDANAIADAQTALATARVAVDQAEHDAVGIDAPAAKAAFSVNTLADRHLQLSLAAIQHRQARLQITAAEHGEDWLAVQLTRSDARAAEESADAARDAWSAACAEMQSALTRAQLTLHAQLEKLRMNHNEIADETVVAPRRGRVYHRLQWGVKPLEVGDQVYSMEPFLMPLGSERRFTIEVPAHLYGRFHRGEAIPFTLPVLSLDPQHGTISEVGAWFGDGSRDRSNALTATASEKVFFLTIGFTLASADLDRVPLGSIAYVDLTP